MGLLINFLFILSFVCIVSKLIIDSKSIFDRTWRLTKQEYDEKYYFSTEECDRSRTFSEYRYACAGRTRELAIDLVNIHGDYWEDRDCMRDWREFHMRYEAKDIDRSVETFVLYGTFRDFTLHLEDGNRLHYASRDEKAALADARMNYPESYGTAKCFLVKMTTDPMDLNGCGDPVGTLTYECQCESSKTLFIWHRQVECCGMDPILESSIKFYTQRIQEIEDNFIADQLKNA